MRVDYVIQMRPHSLIDSLIIHFYTKTWTTRKAEHRPRSIISWLHINSLVEIDVLEYTARSRSTAETPI